MLNKTDFSSDGPQDVLPKKVPPLWWVEGTDRAVHGITFSIPSQFKSNFLSSYSGDWNLQRHVEQKELMSAGWKIHISPYIHDCQAVLEVIAGIAAVEKVTFKHVVSDRDYAERLSRQAQRDIHGKFATIYPHDSKHAVLLANLLANSLEQYDGPKVFTDVPWKNSIVHLRYGAIFPELRMNYGTGMLTSYMRMEDGSLAEDERRPYFYVPPMIEVPHEIKIEQERFESSAAKLPFVATAILSQSSGGSVYEATYNGTPVIVKEGVKEAGIESLGRDGSWRRRKEAAALAVVQNYESFPKLLDTFETERAFYIIVERKQGVQLNKWIAKHCPRVTIEQRDQDILVEIESYVAEVTHQLSQIEMGLDRLHLHGYSYGDLSLSNIMVDDENIVSFIDLETAEPHYIFSNQITTPGYSAGPGAGGITQDTCALGRVALTYFFGAPSPLDVFPSEAFRILELVRERFGIRAFRLVEKYLNTPRDTLKFIAPDLDAIPADLDSGLDVVETLVTAREYVKQISLQKKESWPKLLTPADFSLFRGLAGTIAAFSKAGFRSKIKDDAARLVDYVSIVRDYESHIGLMEGTLGMIVAIAEYDCSASSEMLAGWVNRNLERLCAAGPFVFHGKAGLLLGLLHKYEKNGISSEEASLGMDLVKSIEADYDKLKNVPLSAGILYGWSGVATAIAIWNYVNDINDFDLAVRMIRSDIEYCVWDDGALLGPDVTFPRLMPYVGMGSAGILSAIAAVGFLAKIIPCEQSQFEGLLAACQNEFYALNSLLFGRSGIALTLDMIQNLLSVNAEPYKCYQLRWIRKTTPHRGRAAFCFGYKHMRVSFDYAYGAAGRVLAHIAQPGDLAPYLPFSLPVIDKS